MNFRNPYFGLNAPVPVVGRFSLGIWPLASWPPESGFGHPFILSQTGAIPADAQSLRFLYQGNNLQVYVGGSLAPVTALGNRPTDNPAAPSAPYFAVDVSPFAGKSAQLRFEFRSSGFDDFSGAHQVFGKPLAQMHVLDDLSFSPISAAVPGLPLMGPARPRSGCPLVAMPAEANMKMCRQSRGKPRHLAHLGGTGAQLDTVP